jgi:transposase
MFDVARMHVLDVKLDDCDRLVLTVESDQLVHGCPTCGVLAVGHGRRDPLVHDAPCFGRVTLVRWLKRVWRCREPRCPTSTFSVRPPVSPPRAVLTVWAVRWATDALSHDDTTVSPLARYLGVNWHTAWNAIEVEATDRVRRTERLQNVTTLGVDEHMVRHEALLFDGGERPSSLRRRSGGVKLAAA